MNDNQAHLEQSLQKQMDNINHAITKIRQNELVDISYMNSEVTELCQKILQAEDQTAKNMEGKVIEIINLLDSLSIELKDYQDRVEPKD